MKTFKYFEYTEKNNKRFFTNGDNNITEHGDHWCVHWNAQKIKGEKKYPLWKSHAGLEGWAATLYKYFDLEYERIYVMLVYGDEYRTKNMDIIELLYPLNPFSLGEIFHKNINWWIKKYHFLSTTNFEIMVENGWWDIHSYGEFKRRHKWKSNYEYDNPSDEIRGKYLRFEVYKKEDISRWSFITTGGEFLSTKESEELNSYEYLILNMKRYLEINNKDIVLHVRRYIKNKYADNESARLCHLLDEERNDYHLGCRRLRDVFGKSKKDITKILLRIIKKPQEEWIIYPPSKFNINHAMKSGISLKEILPYQNNKERKTMMKKGYGEFLYRDASEESWDLLMKKLQIPKTWIKYIGGSVLKAKWASRHINQLSKSREVFGPNGNKAIYQYHLVLRDMDDEMLVNGEKTAWRKVMQSVEKKIKRILNKQLGINQPLPELEFHMKGVKPINSSHKLRNEGDVMGHCVGGYIDFCLEGKSFIYHVGRPAPHGSTVEICCYNGVYSIQQIYGYRNSSASTEDRILADEFVKHLNKKEEVKK